MRRTTNRLAILFAATLVMGCVPETSTPSSSEPANADVILKPGATKGGVEAPIRKVKKPPGPSAGTPRASSVKPNPNL
jgi:hypothetical protein